MHPDPLRCDIAVGNRSRSVGTPFVCFPLEVLQCDFAITNRNFHMPLFLSTNELLRSNPPMRYRYRIVASRNLCFTAYFRFIVNLRFFVKSSLYHKLHVLP